MSITVRRPSSRNGVTQVVAADALFRPPALDTGDCIPSTFTEAGDFLYFCGLHPHRQGKITVVP